MQGFKDFLFRGNLIELAVAFIIGGAFATVVKGFTEIIIEILTKAVGNVSFDKWAPGGFTTVGPFLTGLVSFVILAVVVYFALVKPYEGGQRPPQEAGRRCTDRADHRGPSHRDPRPARCPEVTFAPPFGRRASSLTSRPSDIVGGPFWVTSAVERRRAVVSRRR
jgi:large conductance mechanosensitive channel